MSNQCVVSCPLCMEEMDPTDQHLKPCKCGYEICVWCWNHIIQMAEKDDTEGRCPACRAPYDKERILRITISTERLVKQDSQKQKLRKSKSKASELSKDLNTVRVIRRNLVYVAGVPVTLADEMTLRKKEFFGQYGKIVRVVVVPAVEAFLKSRVVYITFSKEEEALRCIKVVDGFTLDGSHLKACFGTTRYCHAWLKNSNCNNANCPYVHDICPQEDICTKDEVASACASKLQQPSGYVSNNLLQRSGSILPPPTDTFCRSSNTAGKSLVQSLAHKPFDNDKKHFEDGDGRKHRPVPPTASWASTFSSGRLSYASVAVSRGPVDHPLLPSNFVMKATDAGARVLAPFGNFNRSDEQIDTSRSSMTATNELVKTSASSERHIDVELKENTGLPKFRANGQTNIAVKSTACGSSYDSCSNDKVQKIIALPFTSNLDRSNQQLSVAFANDFIRCPRMDKTKLDSSYVFCSAISGSNQGSGCVASVSVALSPADEYSDKLSKQDTPILDLQPVSHGPLLKDASATQVHAPYYDKLSGCSNVILMKLCNKHEASNTAVSIDNSCSISSSSTGSSKLLGCGAFGSSTCSAVGFNSILHKQGILQNKSSSCADEDFELRSLEYQSHKPPLLEKGIINRNIGDSREDNRISDESDKSKKEHDIISDILSLDLGHVDHIIGPLHLATLFADNGISNYLDICDAVTSCNGSNSVYAFARMDNLDHATEKSFFSESNVFNMETCGQLDNVERSAIYMNTPHIYSGLPASDFDEEQSLNSQHSIFATRISSESKSLFTSCQSASTSKSKGSRLSAFSAQARSVPPGFHPQVADDLDPPLKLSRSGSGFKSNFHGYSHIHCSQEITRSNSYDHHEIDDSATTAFCGGMLFQSSHLASPNCGPSTVDFAEGNQMLSKLRNFAENSVVLTNESRASIVDNISWQNGTDIYNVPRGSCSLGSYTGRESEVTERSLSEILNSLIPGSKYGSLR